MSTIAEVLGIKSPKPWVIKAQEAGSFPELMMGAELEVEECNHDSDWYSERTNKLGWQTTTDGSLRGANTQRHGHNGGYAYEFISKPMQQQNLLPSLKEFLAITGFGPANYTDRTSVHLHVNCLDLTFDQVSAVALNYTVVEEILFRFIGQEREHNIYCIPWAQCRMNHDMVARIQADSVGTLKRWQKYTALNLLPLVNQGTVEFRHMHGTADTEKLTTWINIIGAIFKYSTSIGLTELITEIKGLNSNSEYEAYFNKVLGGYLPFNNDYRASLEAGVITAKFGLMNWKKDTPKAKVAPQEMAWATLDTVEEAPQGGVTFRRLGEAPAPRPRNRFAPWPSTGFRATIGSLNAEEHRTLQAVNLQNIWAVRDGVILEVTGQLPDQTAQAFERVFSTARRGRPQPPVATPARANPFNLPTAQPAPAPIVNDDWPETEEE